MLELIEDSVPKKRQSNMICAVAANTVAQKNTAIPFGLYETGKLIDGSPTWTPTITLRLRTTAVRTARR